MIEHFSKTKDSRRLLRESLQVQASLPTIHVARHQPIYVSGDSADKIYFIETGQIKLLMLSPEGKECLLAIHAAGDIFGELCLVESGPRQETAIAMEDTVLKTIPCDRFFRHLSSYLLLEGFTQHLAARVSEQQQMIATLLSVDGEHRLGETLLSLARKLGKPHPPCIRIEHKITHEDLSRMVGTTRPRVTHFLSRFRCLGLIEISSDHHLIVNEKKLANYLNPA